MLRIQQKIIGSKRKYRVTEISSRKIKKKYLFLQEYCYEHTKQELLGIQKESLRMILWKPLTHSSSKLSF